jgi:hypothetical protein
MVAVQNYHGNPAPPGKPVLTFQMGDVIELLRGDPESQWWEVGLGQKYGGLGVETMGEGRGCLSRSLPPPVCTVAWILPQLSQYLLHRCHFLGGFTETLC